MKGHSPLNLDGSISKNFEVIKAPQDEEADDRSDVAQAPSESRLLDDLSAPGTSQRSSLDTQPFSISREPSLQNVPVSTFSDKLAIADKLSLEAQELQEKKIYMGAIDKLKTAVEILKPDSLDKAETEVASKKFFEYTLKISENYFSAADYDQALNFSQMVYKTDQANLGAALLISRAYCQKNQDQEALNIITNSLTKYGRRSDQSDNFAKVQAEQKRLREKLNPQPVVPEPKKEEKSEKKEAKEEKSEKDWSYTIGYGFVGAAVGLGASYLFKLPTAKKALLTSVFGLASIAVAYFKGDDDKRK